MYSNLILNDIKYIKKDPMIWFSLIAPVLLVFIYKFIILNLDFLIPYICVINYGFIIMTCLLSGMVFGFRFLDDKDENMLSFYCVSPLGIRGYISYRMILTGIFGAFGTIIVGGLAIGITNNIGIIIIQAMLLSLIIFLIIGIFGKNKIQGLTLTKIVGMVIMLPALKVIGENKFDRLFIAIPSYNVFQILTSNGGVKLSIVYIGIMVIGIIFLIKYFTVNE